MAIVQQLLQTIRDMIENPVCQLEIKGNYFMTIVTPTLIIIFLLLFFHLTRICSVNYTIFFTSIQLIALTEFHSLIDCLQFCVSHVKGRQQYQLGVNHIS